MIVKKTRKADLERKRFAFFQIGLILAGSICLIAFEFVTPVLGAVDKQNFEVDEIVALPEVPKEFYASSQPKKRTIQPIDTEVKLVVELPPNPKPNPAINKKISTDLDKLLTMFGEDDGNDTIIISDLGPVILPDVMPKFNGDLSAWIGKNIKLPVGYYPTSGTIYVSFVVGKQGEIANVKIAKSLDPEHDKSAIDVVKKMPNWIPGEQFGRPVAVNYHLPIKIVNR
ncbi:MAG: energy transducer TonB [Crocinitomicaceae bacterium]